MPTTSSTSTAATGTSRSAAPHGPPADLALPALHRLDPATGLWSGVRQLASPHRDARPDGEAPSAMIVHNISLPPSTYGAPRARDGNRHIDDLFLGRLDPTAHPYFAGIAHLRVSAHACVFRDGSVTQYVPTHERAWHAGESRFDGRERCNDFTIGIELEGSDFEPFADAQYVTAARLIAAAHRVYPAITLDRIVGHEDIAPGRKTDPGPHFDWPRLLALVEFPR